MNNLDDVLRRAQNTPIITSRHTDPGSIALINEALALQLLKVVSDNHYVLAPLGHIILSSGQSVNFFLSEHEYEEI